MNFYQIWCVYLLRFLVLCGTVSILLCFSLPDGIIQNKEKENDVGFHNVYKIGLVLAVHFNPFVGI